MPNKIHNSSILITGGAGLWLLCGVEEVLKYKPARIIIIDNLIRASFENMSSFINRPEVKFIEGDIRDTDLLESLMKGVDYVFHMAALRIMRAPPSAAIRATNARSAFGALFGRSPGPCVPRWLTARGQCSGWRMRHEWAQAYSV